MRLGNRKIYSLLVIACLLAAILAGCGVGIYSSVEEGARRTVKWDCRYEPQTRHAPVYEALYQTWRRVYPVQLDLCNQKLTQNMWIAPGL